MLDVDRTAHQPHVIVFLGTVGGRPFFTKGFTLLGPDGHRLENLDGRCVLSILYHAGVEACGTQVSSPGAKPVTVLNFNCAPVLLSYLVVHSAHRRYPWSIHSTCISFPSDLPLYGIVLEGDGSRQNAPVTQCPLSVSICWNTVGEYSGATYPQANVPST